MPPQRPLDPPGVRARFLDEVRERVDPVLRSELERARRELAEADPESAVLVEEIDRLVRAGGKRLRPAFCFLGFRAAAGDEGRGLSEVAAALELLHTFALIHDDVMDDSTVRRGVACVHVSLAELHRSRGRPGDADRFGRSAAVLAGDLAAVLADRLLLSAGLGPETLLAVMRRVARMRVEMAAGQFLDLAATGASDLEIDRARRIAVLKTAGYTVEGPLQIGATVAGAPMEVLAALARYGAPLGEAFQVRDDLLGAAGTGEEADVGADLREGKPTVLLAEGTRRAGAALDRARRSPGAEREVREVLESSGAMAEAGSLVDRLVGEAVASLDGAPLEPTAVELLRDVADLLRLPAPA